MTQIGLMGGGSSDLSLVPKACCIWQPACRWLFVGPHFRDRAGERSDLRPSRWSPREPDQFGKAMIFPAMVETYAILALLISILSVFGISSLSI
jgi:V/A-type H+-transporting ATPase subunit K